MAEDLGKIESSINSFIQEARLFIAESSKEGCFLPDWKQIQTASNLYSGYREAILKDQKISSYLVRLGYMKISATLVKDSVINQTAVPSNIRLSQKARIERWQANIKDIYDILQTMKDSSSNVIRFYSSAQYILGSPRLSPTD